MTHPSFPPIAGAAAVPRPLVLLLATGAGLAVASIYYSQPMLAALSQSLGADARTTGLVKMSRAAAIMA